jgi:outer membrane protein
MKNIAVFIGLIILCLSHKSDADTLLGLYAGAQIWNMQTSGGFSSNDDNANFNFDEQANSNLYMAFEHPVPLIPNVKLQKTVMDTNGETTLETSFDFGGKTYASSSNLITDVELTATDFILYYELFDNDLISFDLGLNTKYIDGDLFVTDNGENSNSAREKFSGPIPMAYSRLALGLPLTGFGAFVEGSYVSVDDQTLSDYQAAVTYSLIENLAIDLTFQIGYRVITLELDDLDNIYADLKFKGFFAGLEVHF